jgi:deazaflavin-dependent oxidoreductase (nitroreductase family)
MTPLPPWVRRLIGRALRMPAALDRPRSRWLLDSLSPAPIVVLVHRGRRTGRIYTTPVEAVAGNVERGEYVIAPMWGESSDWYRNVIAGGLVAARVRGEAHRCEWRQLSEEERRNALATYRREHPVYGRAVLQMLMSFHGLAGEPGEAIARALPMLALRGR